jgi:hypothetical protein
MLMLLLVIPDAHSHTLIVTRGRESMHSMQAIGWNPIWDGLLTVGSGCMQAAFVTLSGRAG